LIHDGAVIEEKRRSTDPYSVGALSHDIPTELHRLRLLEDQLDPVSTAVLADRELPAAPRCLELGAGAGSMARWMAERHPAGQVTAVDVDARYLDSAWAPNLDVREDDIRTLDFPAGSFDLVHARTLFMHLPEREDLVARAATWLAPDGWLVLEDVSTFPCESSPYPEWQEVMKALAGLLERQGSDLGWARRRQPAVLADAGLADLGMSVEVFTVGDGGPAERFWRAFLDQLRPAVSAQGLLTAGELDKALALFDEPGFVDTAEAVISAWGRRR
jgi:SAM-dependent methyltransferase